MCSSPGIVCYGTMPVRDFTIHASINRQSWFIESMQQLAGDFRQFSFRVYKTLRRSRR